MTGGGRDYNLHNYLHDEGPLMTGGVRDYNLHDYLHEEVLL